MVLAETNDVECLFVVFPWNCKVECLPDIIHVLRFQLDVCRILSIQARGQIPARLGFTITRLLLWLFDCFSTLGQKSDSCTFRFPSGQPSPSAGCSFLDPSPPQFSGYLSQLKHNILYRMRVLSPHWVVSQTLLLDFYFKYLQISEQYSKQADISFLILSGPSSAPFLLAFTSLFQHCTAWWNSHYHFFKTFARILLLFPCPWRCKLIKGTRCSSNISFSYLEQEPCHFLFNSVSSRWSSFSLCEKTEVR